MFVDQATRYNWTFGLKTLTSADIIEAFNLFKAKAGGFAMMFRTNCDEKLFGTAIKTHLTSQNSDVTHALAGRQSSIGLVESHWKTMVHMSRAYLTDKQMPRNFWFFSIQHATHMMNIIPGTAKQKLVSPFMLIHGCPPDACSWVNLFLIYYFHHTKDGHIKRSKNQSNSMDGVIVGRSLTSNTLLVWNP